MPVGLLGPPRPDPIAISAAVFWWFDDARVEGVRLTYAP